MLLLADLDHFLGGQHVVVADGLAELAHDLVIGHGRVLWMGDAGQPAQPRRRLVAAAPTPVRGQRGQLGLGVPGRRDPGGPLQHPAQGQLVALANGGGELEAQPG
jgi:hypothetical protein